MGRISYVTVKLASEIPVKESELKKLSEAIKQLEEQAFQLNDQSKMKISYKTG